MDQKLIFIDKKVVEKIIQQFPTKTKEKMQSDKSFFI